jgi:uncharacterized protein YceK
MGRLKFGLEVVCLATLLCLAMLLAGCGSVVGDADAGPNPGGGFYTGPNMNVGQINPPGFHQGHALAERP